jgi:NAD(P)-dependent dehydrogenase (short-subunit alcohol dehydrogenase family)
VAAGRPAVTVVGMSVVLITGGSSGIGLATVRRLAAAGHQVFSASRNPARTDLPAGATPLVLDLADPASCRAAIAAVVEDAGRLDVLVNNAGTASIAPLEETADDEPRRMFEVNVFGPMRLATTAVPVMRAQGGGRILNVTSGNDIAPAPFGGWYSASKAALASASMILDAEVHGFGIFVTVVAPGLYLTPMAQSLPSYGVHSDSPYGAAFDTMHKQTVEAVENAGDPDEVARAVEDCMNTAEPPARLVVGADAQEMDKTVREAGPEGVAKLLREYVASLNS